MEVQLQIYSPIEDTVKIWRAYRQCYHAGLVSNIQTPPYPEMCAFLVNNMMKGHLSPLEHVQLTFLVSGVSRVLTHQLVRHRIASYSQQSQRYCRANTNAIVLPKSVQAYYGKYPDKYTNLKKVLADYHSMLASGVPQEDARYILPEGMSSNIFITMNIRSLLHFFNERLCGSAQQEIRDMAGEMAKLVVENYPWLREFVGPKCMGKTDCADGKMKLCREHIKWPVHTS